MKSRYLLFQKTEAALIEEKAEKLFGITRLLDRYLEGDYNDLLARTLRTCPMSGKCKFEPSSQPGADLPQLSLSRDEAVRALNSALAPYTDLVAAAFPGVGVGYYSCDLRAILTYGPSAQFGSKVGMDLGIDHLGWRAMETGKETVAVGSMVRGEIMNCMRPLIRGGRAIGFVWANETLEDIYAQIQLGARKLFFSSDTEPLLGLTGLLLFSSRVLISGKWGKDSYKQLMRDVERLERYLKLFLNSLSLAVILSDAEGKITFVSSGIKDILGPEAQNIINQDVQKAFASFGIDLASVLDDIEGADRGPDEARTNRFVNVPLRTKEGEKLITMVSAEVREPGDHGSSSGRVIILEDLKEARAQEERLERAERLAVVGELAAAIAHEIKNPLTILKGAVSLMPAKLDNPEFLGKFAEVANGEMDRINRTVESLLNFARFSQPNMRLADIGLILTRACNVISAYARVNRVDLRVNCPGDLPRIRADDDHLTNAFLNLMLNGIQAMPHGGLLTVEGSFTPGGRFLQVSVRDTGEGIPPEHRDRVFDMFFTTKAGGTGLGLPLVQRIIYEHGGFVEFESEVGRGTTFIVKLPVVLEG